MNKKFSPQIVQTKEIDRENYTMRFVMSTPEIDRHGEVIDQKGWDFSPFMLNPVVLWGHDQSIPAVGKVIAIEQVNGNTEGVVKFAVKENPDAKVLFDLYAEGFMSAVSVGFMNLKWMYDEVKDVVTLLENELFELSLVNVPANASALSKAHAKGFDTSVVERLSKHQKHSTDERFKDLGEEEKPEVEEETPVVVEEEQPVTVPEEVAEPTKTPAEVTPSDEEVDKALDTLSRSGNEQIKASVKELSSRLNDASATKETVAKKGLSNKTINRLVRSLLKAKETTTS